MTEKPEALFSDQQMLEEIVQKFSKAMQLRSEMSNRIARRVTLIIRIGVVTLALSALALLLLIYVLSDKAASVVGSMEIMNSHFTEMSRNLQQMEANVQLMSGYTEGVPTIMNEIRAMEGSMQHLNSDMSKINDHVTLMHGDINGISRQMTTMDQNFDEIGRSVYGVSQDVKQISKPMKTFNSFFPFP